MRQGPPWGNPVSATCITHQLSQKYTNTVKLILSSHPFVQALPFYNHFAVKLCVINGIDNPFEQPLLFYGHYTVKSYVASQEEFYYIAIMQLNS